MRSWMWRTASFALVVRIAKRTGRFSVESSAAAGAQAFACFSNRKITISQLDDLLRDLVIANRILSNEDVVDAYGHISVRHPHNLIEFDQEGEPVNDKRQPYLERFIHAAIFEARPDATAVVHAHAEDTLPFGLVATPLEPVIHSGSFIGGKVPVWDIRTKFGDTNLLVTDMMQGRDLAQCMGDGNLH
jgi:hypothetical protein